MFNVLINIILNCDQFLGQYDNINKQILVSFHKALKPLIINIFVEAPNWFIDKIINLKVCTNA